MSTMPEPSRISFPTMAVAVPVLGVAMILFLGILPAPGLAQAWQGEQRLTGVVLDEDEKPLRGAEVRLVLADAPSQGPPPTRTNAKGRFTLARLAAARWQITITAEGYIRSEGWAQTAPGRIAPLRVMLQPLSIVTPSMAENPGSVMSWLEKGNSLLEQGRPAEARKEYEKALRVLPPAEQPEVLRAVARTHYLEGDIDAAARALRHALVRAPGDDLSRRLLLGLLEGAGRGAEARRFIDRLDAEGPEILRRELEPILAARGEKKGRGREEPPLVAPEAGRTGAYRTSFREQSPLSDLAVYAERHGQSPEEIRALDPQAAAYDLTRETFEVVVPELGNPPGGNAADGDAAGEDAAWGLFVWVSPTPAGRTARPENLAVLAEKRLIWVGANNAGNRRPRWDRIGLALDAAHNLQKLYPIDPRRVYAGGYSGGGRITSALAVLYPEVFRGGFSFFGVDFYRDVPVADKPGAVWPAAFPKPPPLRLEPIAETSRLVFLTGERDFNRAQTRIFHRLYQEDGFRHVTYLEIPGADHYFGIRGEWLARGIDALDHDHDPP